ncbi:MAG: sensor histidine kinase [Gaiella sp.]
METIALHAIAELGRRTLASSAEAIAVVAELAQRVSGTDVTVVSEVTDDGRYVFRGLEKRPEAPLSRDDAIPWEWSLCSRHHAGEAPNTIADTREVPAIWSSWQRLKGQLGVDWDVLAFCTRDVRLPDGTFFGTLCLHELTPRSWTDDEQALLELLATLLGHELARERAAEGLEQALAALDDAERRRLQLAEELQHEIRAPLQVIDAYAEAMLDGVLDRTDEQLGLVRREAGRAIGLLDDIVELTRLEAGTLESDVATVDLGAVAKEMVERMRPLTESSGLVLEYEAEHAPVTASRRRLEQVLVNLVRNALRSAQHGGGSRIRVLVERVGIARLTVEDDGPGLPPEERDRVFDRFFRGSSAREAGAGSGLGLPIVRRIVEAAGGEVTLDDADPRGLRVVVELPLAPEHPSGGGESAA